MKIETKTWLLWLEEKTMNNMYLRYLGQIGQHNAVSQDSEPNNNLLQNRIETRWSRKHTLVNYCATDTII